MQISVLGKSPSWADAGGACSGYLVCEAGYTLLLDCGSGAFAKLRAVCDYAEVDAVLISHMHSDHFVDLVPFANALRFGPRGRAGTAPRPPVTLPPGGAEVLRAAALTGGFEGLVDDAFEVGEYDPDGELSLGPLTARFCAVPHFIPAYAVQLSAGDARFTFGADCGPSEALVRFAADTDLLLIEATMGCAQSAPAADGTAGGERGHLTAREAGEHGLAARARALVLTHFSDELDAEDVLRDAIAGFGGPVALAHEGASYRI
ncbi:MAG: MBL fold metallo-hydrolase [Solirubrobacteraceae bacterium]